MQDKRYCSGCLLYNLTFGEVFAEHAPPLLNTDISIRFSISVVDPFAILMDLLTKILVLCLIPVPVEILGAQYGVCHGWHRRTHLQPGIKPSEKRFQNSRRVWKIVTKRIKDVDLVTKQRCQQDRLDGKRS